MLGKLSGRVEGEKKKSHTDQLQLSLGSSQPGTHSARTQPHLLHLYRARHKQHPTPKSTVGINSRERAERCWHSSIT